MHVLSLKGIVFPDCAILCKTLLDTCTINIDIHQRSQNLRHLYFGMGLKLVVFGFSRNQNNRGSSGAYVTCIYCSPSVKISTRKNAARRAKILGTFVLRVWLTKTRRPPI